MKDLGLTLNWVMKHCNPLKTGTKLEEHGRKRISGISTDSRTIKSSEIFVALKGDNFDGHQYLSQALKKGALAVVVQNTVRGVNARQALVVPDTLKALGDLAAALRVRQQIKVVAITGSNGKTTTKEMLAWILSLKYRGLLATKGNYNNLVGLPLTLFRMEKNTDMAILEMGMNHFAEIARLTEIAQPDVGLITSVGAAHIEFFGSLSRVAKAKGELYEGLNPEAIAVVDIDDDLIVRESKKFGGNKLYFGTKAEANIKLVKVKSKGLCGQELTLTGPGTGKGLKIYLKLLGAHNARNALAAAACALACGADWGDIVCGLEKMGSYPGRLALLKAPDFLILDDSYNANPSSVAAGLDLLAGIKRKGAKGAILGDMAELGSKGLSFHKELGRQAAVDLDFLAGVGPLSRSTVRAAGLAGMPKEALCTFDTPEEAAKWVATTRPKGSLVLVKGSRSMELERAVTYLQRHSHKNRDKERTSE